MGDHLIRQAVLRSQTFLPALSDETSYNVYGVANGVAKQIPSWYRGGHLH